MKEDAQTVSEGAIQSPTPVDTHALDVSIGGVFEQRHPLRRDRPTWTGRRPTQRFEDCDYIEIPGSEVRWLCGFNWDPQEGRFWVTTGGAAYVWLNAQTREQLIGPNQQRLLIDGDVIIVSRPHYLCLTLVRCET